MQCDQIGFVDTTMSSVALSAWFLERKDGWKGINKKTTFQGLASVFKVWRLVPAVKDLKVNMFIAWWILVAIFSESHGVSLVPWKGSSALKWQKGLELFEDAKKKQLVDAATYIEAELDFQWKLFVFGCFSFFLMHSHFDALSIIWRFL